MFVNSNTQNFQDTMNSKLTKYWKMEVTIDKKHNELYFNMEMIHILKHGISKQNNTLRNLKIEVF